MPNNNKKPSNAHEQYKEFQQLLKGLGASSKQRRFSAGEEKKIHKIFPN